MRPKVCIICTTPLAVHFFLKNHIRGLALFADVTLMTNFLNDPYTPPLDLPVRIVPIGIKREIVLWRDICTLLELIRLLYREKYDLVWAVGPKAGLLGMTAATLAGVKNRLFIFQGEVWASKTGFQRWLIKSMDSVTARLATRLLAVGRSERAFLESEGVVPAGKMKVLGEGSIAGVDVGKFRRDDAARENFRAQHGIPADAIVALFLGRLHPDKGIIDLLHAFKSARTKCPSLWLLVVGPDEGGMRGDIQRILAQDMPYCKIEGFTPSPETYFFAADFFCLPSYREGFPVSILEAGAAGICTVGSNIYGISDAIVDGDTGVLFEVGNVASLSEAMVQISVDKTLRQRLDAAAHTRIRRHFDQIEVVARYIDFYKECMSLSL